MVAQPFGSALRKPWVRWFLQWSRINQLLCLSERLVDAVARVHDERAAALQYIDGALAALGVRYEVRGRSAPPTEGPLVVVANHPYGGLEGLLLLRWLLSSRADVKVMANSWLAALLPLRPLTVGVDVFAAEGASAAAQRNARAMRESLRQLERGGVLLAFPAGEVAHLQGQGLIAGPVVRDGPWRLGVAHLLRRTQSPVLPVWVDGCNSAGFQAAGLVHPRLRTALLPRELLNKGGRCVVLNVGDVIPAARWSKEGDAQGVTDFLRLRAALGAMPDDGGKHPAGAEPADPRREAFQGTVATPMPLAPAVAPAQLSAELGALRPESCLLITGRFRVYRLRLREAPAVLQEIGRLRELTFREVGEGTGRAEDLDRFDAHYWHLVLWDSESEKIAGAYRLAEVDAARDAAGKDGLYTSTLFHFREPVPGLLGRAVELGRSFICTDYQRQHLPLMLLWRAIGLHIMSQPRRHWLFGPASISVRLRPAAAAVIIEWLRLHRRHPVLATLVSGRTPVPYTRCSRELQAELRRMTGVEALDRLVADLDPTSGGLPPLLRQYLRLGARFIAVNRDTGFADAIDVLVLVDLDLVPEKALARLVGAETVAAFKKRRQDESFITGRLLPATKLSYNARIT